MKRAAVMLVMLALATLWAAPTFAQEHGQEGPQAPARQPAGDDRAASAAAQGKRRDAQDAKARQESNSNAQRITTDRRAAKDSPSDRVGTRVRPTVERDSQPTVRVRATVAVIDPQVGVRDIIADLRMRSQERLDNRKQHNAAAVELRRMGRNQRGQGGGNAASGGKTGATAAQTKGELQPTDRTPSAAATALDPQRNIGRERLSERQNELRMRERLEKRRDMLDWRRSRSEGGSHHGDDHEPEDER